MYDSVLKALCVKSHAIPQESYEVGAIIIPVLQMRTFNLSDVSRHVKVS